MISGYVRLSSAISSSFLEIRLPQDPMEFPACKSNQQHLVHWNRSLLHCHFYQLQLLPGICLQLRKKWHLHSGHFGHVWMSFQIIQDDSSTSSKILNIRILENWRHFIYFSESEDIKVWLLSLRGHQLRHIHSNLSQSNENAKAPNFNGGKCKGFPHWNLT